MRARVPKCFVTLSDINVNCSQEDFLEASIKGDSGIVLPSAYPAYFQHKNKTVYLYAHGMLNIRN